MPRRDWYNHTADEINERYIEYFGSNKTFADQNNPVTVKRFADVVRPIYDAKKIDLADEGVDDPHLKIANHLREIMESSYEGVNDTIRDHLPEVEGNSDGLSKYNQGVSKTGGMLHEYLVAYNLAENLLGTKTAVAFHKPPEIKQATTLKRDYAGDELKIELEGDIVVFDPSDKTAPVILISMKSSMKERSHIATMWSLLHDIGKNKSSREEYGIEVDDPNEILENAIYTFVTADLYGDFDGNTVRNLIKMDISFMDYFFLARADFDGAAKTVEVGTEHLVHHLEAIYDLISKTYDIDYDEFGAVDFTLTDDGIKRDHELGDYTED